MTGITSLNKVNLLKFIICFPPKRAVFIAALFQYVGKEKKEKAVPELRYI
jgi:hypothetical protein